MSTKKKKNGNYITEKTIAKKQEAFLAAKRKKRRETLSVILKISAVILLIAAMFVGTLAACGVFRTSFKITHHASIEIEGYGTLHVELYGNEAPETVENFVKLAEEGFYNGLTFHRIIDGFMAQGGDPKGNGTGDSGEDIKGEFKANGFNNRIKHERGVISMARGNDYDSGSCQFFIVHQTSENNTKSLDGNYAAFGRVIEGMEFVDEMIKNTPVVQGEDGKVNSNDQPIIKSITIHEAH